jgi:hypothetical protein
MKTLLLAGETVAALAAAKRIPFRFPRSGGGARIPRKARTNPRVYLWVIFD